MISPKPTDAVALLRELEWIGDEHGHFTCPICLKEVHAPDCRLAKAIADQPAEMTESEKREEAFYQEPRPQWRIGSHHHKIHVYEGERPVATFMRPEDAERAIADRNAAGWEKVSESQEGTECWQPTLVKPDGSPAYPFAAAPLPPEDTP
jgi:hypothetical protein